MAEPSKFDHPGEDPFENQATNDPFVENHFGGGGGHYGASNQTYNANSSVWSENLPDSTAVLVLGILSIIGSFCYGVVGLILGIIGLAVASRPQRLYNANPGRYSHSSYSNLKAGKVCNIIGICISAVFVLFMLFFFVAVSNRW
jgi:hypothetical protein